MCSVYQQTEFTIPDMGSIANNVGSKDNGGAGGIHGSNTGNPNVNGSFGRKKMKM